MSATTIPECQTLDVKNSAIELRARTWAVSRRATQVTS